MSSPFEPARPIDAPPYPAPAYAQADYGAPAASAQWSEGTPPRLTATILVTFLFGLFGLIPAILGARRARNLGRPEGRYWVAFGATLAGSIALYVLVVVIAFTTLLGVATRSETAATSRDAASATANASLAEVRARVQAIVAAHGPAVAVLSAIDPATSAALSANPNDVAALGKALSEVAGQQGASAEEQQQVATAMTQRAPQMAAVQAIPPATLAALQADPTDQTAGVEAVQAIMQKLNVGQSQAIALLQSLASPQVQSDLQLVNKYATVLRQAQADIPEAQLAYLRAHAAEVAASAPTK